MNKRETYLNEPSDIQWAWDRWMIPMETQCIVLKGNKDCPDQVICYAERNPAIDEKPLRIFYPNLSDSDAMLKAYEVFEEIPHLACGYSCIAISLVIGESCTKHPRPALIQRYEDLFRPEDSRGLYGWGNDWTQEDRRNALCLAAAIFAAEDNDE